MSENRATKSGLAREAQMKLVGKYDKDVAARCMRWVAEVTNEPIDTSGDMDKVYEELNNGYVLCKLINAIRPGCIAPSKVKPEKLPFKKMELISMFNQKIKEKPLAIDDTCLFQTADLYDKANITQVITCLEAVARKCNSCDTPVRGFGPREAEANVRQFSEEQLAEGKKIIGLQMGSNKGATQSGQNFGKGRMIVD